VHPLLTKPRALGAYVLTWLLAGGALAFAWSRQTPNDDVWVLGFWLPVVLLTGLAALPMYAVCRITPFRPARWMSTLSRRAAAAVLLALLVTAAAALWNASGPLWGRASLVALTPAAWLAFFGAETLVFALSALIHGALLAQQAIQAAMANEAQARLLAREMEIKALRRQLDPHFLFNSLNSISALIQIDQAAARAMTIDLAQFFRLSVGLGERDRIRLEEELELVQHYLAIEQRRLGEKLRLSIDADAACRQAWLPPLVLQPLVENAIKHGIRHLDFGGLIELGAVRSGDLLTLRVSNPVDALARRDASGLGQGLRHLQQRLKTQYDEPTLVDVEGTAEQYTVRVSLPWQT
jgi:two-component system, LytTR family, sensor histidine kinase AlgZ